MDKDIRLFETQIEDLYSESEKHYAGTDSLRVVWANYEMQNFKRVLYILGIRWIWKK